MWVHQEHLYLHTNMHYFTLFALRINMERSSFCISHFFAAETKMSEIPI